MPCLTLVESVIFGTAPETTTTDDFNESLKTIKDFVKQLNQREQAKTTFGDIWVAARLSIAFQTVLDAGLQKGFAKATEWFLKITSEQYFFSNFGKVKLC